MFPPDGGHRFSPDWPVAVGRIPVVARQTRRHRNILRRAGSCVFAVPSVLLPQIANQAGWFTAEIGRQPWIVWGYLRTSDGLSAVVKAHQVLASLVGFGLIYLLLFVLFLFLLNRKIQHGPEPLEESHDLPENWLKQSRA